MNLPSPSIRARLSRTLAVWSLIWTAAVSAAVWVAVRHEMEDKLDNRLRAASELLVNVMRRTPFEIWHGEPLEIPGDGQDADVEIPFTWQLVDRQGRLLQRADNAPEKPFHTSQIDGLSSAGGWRVFGRALDAQHFLYVAHERSERLEAQVDVALDAALAALIMALIGHLWLRMRFWRELQPLQTLSQKLQSHDPGDGKLALGPAERAELEPLHRAVNQLSDRLADRIRREQGFSAHAAHALRTPLAGVDAQLSIALREAPEPLHARLKRIRSAAQRMQHVVTSLLGLFRAEAGPRRVSLELEALVASLPEAPLAVRVNQAAPLDADADLLSATLINLLDNAARHGAKEVWVTVPAPQRLRVQDDGRGLGARDLETLQRALLDRDYERLPGLGLVLADVVARAHGGQARLITTEQGFTIELDLAEKVVTLLPLAP